MRKKVVVEGRVPAVVRKAASVLRTEALFDATACVLVSTRASSLLPVLVVMLAVVPGAAPACGPSCTPGASRCNAGSAEVCGRDGTWSGTACLAGDASADAARWPTAGCVVSSDGAAMCSFSAMRIAACEVAGKAIACVGDAVVACVDGFPTVGVDPTGMPVYRVCAAGACVDTATTAGCR